MRPRLIAIVSLALAGCGGTKPFQTTSQTNCQVVWANRGSEQGRFDVYVVDGPADAWSGSTLTLGPDASPGSNGASSTAVFYDELDVSSNQYLDAAIATAGTLTIQFGTTIGATVSLTDPGSHTFFDLNPDGTSGNEVGSGGAGSFTGVLSSSMGPSLSPGSGNVQLDVHNDPQTIGTGNPNAPVEYADCYSFTS